MEALEAWKLALLCNNSLSSAATRPKALLAALPGNELPLVWMIVS